MGIVIDLILIVLLVIIIGLLIGFSLSLLIASLTVIICTPYMLLKLIVVKIKEYWNYYKTITCRELIFDVIEIDNFCFKDSKHSIFYHPVPLEQTPTVEQFNKLLHNEPELEIDYLFKTYSVIGRAQVKNVHVMKFYKKPIIHYEKYYEEYFTDVYIPRYKYSEGWITLNKDTDMLESFWQKSKMHIIPQATIDSINHLEPSQAALLDFY